MEKDKLIKMGFVSQPHGLKGEAELRLLNKEDSVLDEDMQVWLFPSNEKSALHPKGQAFLIEKLRFGNKVICQFQGIKDRTELEKIIPFEVYLDREAFPEAEEG